ncbi:MAG: type III secretion system cytoplasmic ring protein SctQ [Chlamydiia bacterium]|nr:type III secretion system cytoplasmic ring protein SctQ [Chlamydiia bacterium]
MGNTPLFPWIRSLSESLPDAFEIPLFGYAPPFDWDHFSTCFKKRIGVEECMITPREQRWLAASEIKQQLGSKPFFASILLHPLSTPCIFAMARPDLNKFTAWMMNRKTKNPLSEPIREAFFQFLLLAALDASNELPPLDRLTLQLQEEASLPETSAFCVDVDMQIESRTFWGRLIIPLEFRKVWKEHFGLSTDYVPSLAAQHTELSVGLQIGMITVSLSEWETLLPGDCLLLDRGSYSLKEQTGLGTLTVGGNSLFRVKITPNTLELFDCSFIAEDSMEHNYPEIPPDKNPHSHRENVSIREIPLNVSVELTRLSITLERLMQLQPGNLIEMPIQLDQNVSLIVNGGKVGTAELVQLGDALGLRILQIGGV